MNAISSDAAAPALARIAELERELQIVVTQLYRANLALAILEPDDTLARLPDGSEIPVHRSLWAEAVCRTVRNNSHEFHDILDALAVEAYTSRI